MSDTIRQPTNNPTNKLTAATAATAAWGAIMAIGGLVLKNLYPEWYDPEVTLAVGSAVPTIVGFAAGWLTSDRPNAVAEGER